MPISQSPATPLMDEQVHGDQNRRWTLNNKNHALFDGRRGSGQAAGTQYFAMDVDEVLVARSRPDRLTEVRPQERVLRRTVEQNVEPVRGVPVLDAPVPQMVDQPLVLLAAFDVLVSEQVIEVPKMSTPTRCPRTVLSVPQTAEQLVEAPNVVSLIDVIRHPLEQTVSGGRIGGLPGFLPGQSYSLSAGQIVDIPVPVRGGSGSGGLQGFHPRQGSLHRTVEQLVDILVPGGGPHDFLPDLGVAAPSAVSCESWINVFFALFPV